MKRSRFSEEQIIGILKEHEAGIPVAEPCRKQGVSDASIYKWKARSDGMEVSEAKRLPALEDENVKLKRMQADAMLDNVALKDLLGKHIWSAPSVQGSRTIRQGSELRLTRFRA
jgi:putative transposase